MLQRRAGGLLGLRVHEVEPTGTVQGTAFRAEMIVLCVRWYLRFRLSFRNLEELMTERNVSASTMSRSGAGSRDTPRNYTNAAARNCG